MEKNEETQAEEFKQKGNALFKENNYEEAINYYSKAIEANGKSQKSAIYFSNRAFCHLKMDNYGLAIEDANSSLNIDPKYPKAYYRKAEAYVALDKYKIAAECFRKVVIEFKIADKDAVEKYKFVKRIIKERAFNEAIHRDDAVDQINIKDIIVDPSYSGPKLEEGDKVTSEWVLNLIEYLKDQKKLHKKYLVEILLRIKDILEKLPNMVEVEVPNNKEITVCGDIHGQFYDLVHIFKINGNPSVDNPYLFNGDFVDRGSFSLEVILTLFAWKVCFPSSFHLTRGNHEAKNMNKLYGFEGEVVSKYDTKVYELFSQIFCYLPLTYILNKKVMVCHGGLFSKDGIKLEEINKVNRVMEPPDSGIMCDLLWADPIKENGRLPSKRGISVGFGPDITKKFLDDNNLELLVRSHEMKDNGYEEDHNGRVITIFSAPNYCDQMKNQGAFIRFNGKDMKPKFTNFSWVDHPKIPVMAYSRGGAGGGFF